MPIRDLLLQELDNETAKTRATLARVPAQPNYKPHDKSMALGRLSAHVAQLQGFGYAILTTPQLDFATAGMKPLEFESSEQLVREFEAGVQQLRQALEKTDDAAWSQPWKLCAGEQVFFTGSRFAAYRAMYANHVVHHRAQLGVYFRLLGVPVPSIYGPSADEH
ncbi:MAG: DinB family protein [Terriglobales bacterium]